jgi:hypothetical protein
MPFYLPNNASCNENPMAVDAVGTNVNAIPAQTSAQWHTGFLCTLKHQVAASEALYAIDRIKLTSLSLNSTPFFFRPKHQISAHVCRCAIEISTFEERPLNGKLDFPVGESIGNHYISLPVPLRHRHLHPLLSMAILIFQYAKSLGATNGYFHVPLRCRHLECALLMANCSFQ